ncbi:ABC transporter permease, partial [Streptomyces sp. NPDC127074]|uniref:ABC transporter permease n=1 Tax=Streptomyces sp. NPDC127074 TaxID=3347130 RepID=UPI003661D97B
RTPGYAPPDSGPARNAIPPGAQTPAAIPAPARAGARGRPPPNPETASNWPMIFILLPFVGSGFVPVESMPTGLRWFAEYQPFTPIINAFRGLLAGSPDDSDVLRAIGWCAVIGLIGYLWSRRLYRTRAAN